MIAYNARFECQAMSGVQRYAWSIVSAIQKEVEITPFKPTAASVWGQHIWEQRSLPRKLKTLGNPLLLNFGNTAPVSYERQIIVLHDAAVFDVPNQHQWWFRAYYRWLFHQLKNRCLHVVTVSEFSADRLQHHLGIQRDRITVIPPLDHPNLLATSATEPAAMPVHSKFILSVGSAHAGKNFEWTAKHLSSWCARNGITYVIAGGSSKNFQSTGHLSTMPHVRCLGSVEEHELRWLYENAQAVLQPSVYEGFGLVPREAALLTSKILVSDIPAHRESAGDMALYFKLEDEQDLMRGLEQVMQRPYAPALQTPRQRPEAWIELIQRFR